MKNLKRNILAMSISLVLLFSVACGGKEDTPKIDYAVYTESTVTFKDNHDQNEKTYNKDLYFRNDLTLNLADPFIAYDNGKYYAYGTSSLSSIPCYESTNLIDWKSRGDCFTPPSDSWGKFHLWAPDVQKIGDKWYLYYTATYNNGAGKTERPQLGVAVSDSPAGPFVQYKGTNAAGKTITNGTPPLVIPGTENTAVLDSSLFKDDDGSLYLYFSVDTRGLQAPGYDTDSAEIWGVKMLDPVTCDTSTLTRLLKPGYKKYDDKVRTIDWETWSPSFGGNFEGLEGPSMLKSNGKYYLTYTANSFIDVEYTVGYAVSGTPLGTYDKPTAKYLDNMLLGVPGPKGSYVNTRYLGFMTGTGHAAVFKVGNEYMFAYHAHKNRDVWGKPPNGEMRSLAVDYIRFDKDGVPYTNGPTYSLIDQPEVYSGYKNLAATATIKSDGENSEYLNDNFTNRGFKTEEVAREANFSAGTKSVEIKFAKPINVKALNVFNSYDYSRATNSIKQIDFGNGKGIANILFNQRYYNHEQKFIYPHTAYNIELDEEIVTDRIVITFESQLDFSLGEIKVMGKE